MKTLITTLNSKYIHKSLSLRLLYVATKEYHEVDLKNIRSKRILIQLQMILLNKKVQVVGFLVSNIWNVDLIKLLN